MLALLPMKASLHAPNGDSDCMPVVAALSQCTHAFCTSCGVQQNRRERYSDAV